ncbi:MAG: DUF4252 domain-containing protein [Bacteroidaceae bacterium]
MMSWICALVIALPLWSQKEQDFAARYMQEMKALTIASNANSDSSARVMLNRKKNKPNEDLELITISPRMVQEMTEKIKNNKSADILSHIKSIRIVKANRSANKYRTEALELLKKNKHRYQPYTTSNDPTDEIQVWMRKRGKKIVELITLNRDKDGLFQVVNVTGEMDDEFIKTIAKM